MANSFPIVDSILDANPGSIATIDNIYVNPHSAMAKFLLPYCLYLSFAARAALFRKYHCWHLYLNAQQVGELITSLLKATMVLYDCPLLLITLDVL